MENSEQAVEVPEEEQTALADTEVSQVSDSPEETPDLEDEINPEDLVELDDGVFEAEVNGQSVRLVPIDDGKGNTLYVQEDAKPLTLMQADYTRKTQGLAEERRAWDQQKMQDQQSQALNRQTFDGEVKLAALDARLAEYDAVNWTAAQQQNPDAANAAMMEYQQLKTQREQLSNEVQTQKVQAFQAQQAQLASARKQSWEQLANEIPDWSETKAVEIGKFGQSAGISSAGLAMLNDGLYGADTVPMMRILHDAMAYRQLVEKAKAKKAPKLKSVKSTSRVKGNAPAQKTLDKAKTTAEYVAMRRAQQGKK